MYLIPRDTELFPRPILLVFVERRLVIGATNMVRVTSGVGVKNASENRGKFTRHDLLAPLDRFAVIESAAENFSMPG